MKGLTVMGLYLVGEQWEISIWIPSSNVLGIWHVAWLRACMSILGPGIFFVENCIFFFPGTLPG